MSSSQANRRQSDRFYPKGAPSVAIRQEQFQLDNISNEGIGIVIDGPDAFFIGQRLDSILFKDQEQERALNGIVSHISKDAQGFLCGIRFLFEGSRDFNYVKELYLKLNRRL